MSAKEQIREFLEDAARSLGWYGDKDTALKYLEKLEAANLDMANTIAAIADPDDYEAGGEKTAETCRRLASECMARNDL